MGRSVLFSLLFVIIGAFNIVIVKWTSIQKGICLDGKLRNFQHPVLFTLIMFIGELYCFAIYKVMAWWYRRDFGSEQDHILTRGSCNFSKLSMLLPALLDAIASLFLFTGLYLTYATSFQMIRGIALVFVGLFNAIFLNQALDSRHWLAMFTMTCGVVVITSMDIQRVEYDHATINHGDYNAVLTGDLLIICAQVLHAMQYVYEEKHIKTADVPPMLAVGYQGLFGLIITIFSGICLNYLPSITPFNANTNKVFDDLFDIWPQIQNNLWLLAALIGFLWNCSAYNFAALTIVKFSSSTNRILTDGLRIYFIWLIVVVFELEYLNLITVMGFIILQMGAISYHNAIFLDWYRAFLARLQRQRYVDLNTEIACGIESTNRPADVI